MSRFADDVVRFERALANAIPESRDWVRTVDDAADTWWVEITSATAPDGRTLSIAFHGREIDLAFSVGPCGVGLGPYEVNAPMPDESDPQSLADFANFVADFLSERLVLAMRRGSFRSGREFLTPDELTATQRRSLEWIASWHGTYDWAVPRI